MPHEVPLKPGLPLKWSDLIGLGSQADLGRALATFLGVESIGVTCSGTASRIVRGIRDVIAGAVGGS